MMLTLFLVSLFGGLTLMYIDEVYLEDYEDLGEIFFIVGVILLFASCGLFSMILGGL